MSKQLRRRGSSQIQIGPKGGVGILAGVALAIIALAVFHSAAVMAGIAVVLIILWIIAPRKRK